MVSTNTLHLYRHIKQSCRVDQLSILFIEMDISLCVVYTKALIYRLRLYQIWHMLKYPRHWPQSIIE